MNSCAIPEIEAAAAWALDRLAPGRARLGVAVSGGSDSTALLLLAASWAQAAGVELACATVDHGLRREAADEARMVARLCERLGVAHATLEWRPDRTGVSQAEAREARRGLLADWAHGGGLPAVALGHTADDRIETFLIRARAGSGWYGLAGPMPSAPSPAAGVRLVRPLLWARREMLRSVLRNAGVDWAEDPTNQNPRYERVRMRRMAAMMDPRAGEAILRSMDRLAHLRAAVMSAAAGALADCEADGERLRLEAGRYRGLGAEARLRLLESLVAASRPGLPPPERDSLARVDDAVMGGQAPGSTLGRLVIRLRKGAVEVSVAPPRRSEAGEKSPEAGMNELLAAAGRALEDPAIETMCAVRARATLNT